MKNLQTTVDLEVIESNRKLYNRFKLFVLKPLLIGLFTFAIFFTTILITKTTTYLFSDSLFNLNIYDVLFALLGFLLGFLLEFLLQVRKMIFK